MAHLSFVLTSIKKVYSADSPVLRDVSLTFIQGSSYALTGASGSGKTTLLHIMAGIESPTAGSVVLGGHNMYTIPERERSVLLRNTLGLVFQSAYLIKELTVLENVMLKGIIAGKPTAGCKDEAYLLLESVGLIQKATSMPAELSGGQQQRVALARALFSRPSFLLADEPTGNLDAKTGEQIMDLLVQFQKEYNMGLIVSSHNQYVIERMQAVYEVRGGDLVLIPLRAEETTLQESYRSLKPWN